MADHLQIKVSVTPIEELTTENLGTTEIIASEIGKSLSGSGDSVDLANYSGSAADQGYKDSAVNYLDITQAAGGTQIRSGGTDAIFIRNTGFKFSTTTKLGAVTTDCILVVIKEVAYSNGVDGGYQTSVPVAQDHFYEVAWLKPGQAVVLPLGGSNLSISQFGSNANDLSPLGQTSGNGQARVFGKTVQADGSAALDGNALEFLAVS